MDVSLSQKGGPSGNWDLGQPTKPDPKGEGDQSMSVKQGPLGVSPDAALQDPRGMVKAALLEVQPRSVDARPVATLTQRDVARALPEELGEEQARRRDTGRSNPGVGVSGRPKPRSTRASTRNLKIAYRARAPGRRSLHSSPRPGEPATWRREAGSSMAVTEEVRDMRDAETTLAIIRERGKRGLPLERVYRQLFNQDLYLRAYGRLYRNAGAMTKGTTPETVDGMSRHKIEEIIAAVRHERFRWAPVRRAYILKGNGKLRPLGIPTWRDKLLQEVMRSILEAYYEPQFSPTSHGFRPERGCHTALRDIFCSWTGTKWFIEGDIKGCFDNIGHTTLMSILHEKIHDGRFLTLVENLLKAGYLEQWDFRPTLSGTPQGGSPARCSRISTWTGSISSSSGRSSRNTPKGSTGGGSRSTANSATGLRGSRGGAPMRRL